MNRKIKFRVFNKKTNKWIHGPNKDNSLDGINILGENILLGNFLNGVSVMDLDEIEVVQFTGLQDKNGKDIFEGDILNVKDYDGWSDKEGYYYKSIVFYNERLACFEHGFNPKIGGVQFIKDSVTCELDIEVIGNIFENNDLIKKYEEKIF